MLEDFGQLQLNGTDSDSSNAGNHILQETDKRKLKISMALEVFGD